MAVEGERLTEPPADLPAVLAERGLRVPTSDEWEHACGAGADTLFRWGDDCPLDRVPYGDRTGPHNEPNAFGLRIAHDTYSTELTSDTGEVRGGDGGESVCGGYGHLLAWLPLATAHTHPDMATEHAALSRQAGLQLPVHPPADRLNPAPKQTMVRDQQVTLVADGFDNRVFACVD